MKNSDNKPDTLVLIENLLKVSLRAKQSFADSFSELSDSKKKC